MKFEDLGIINYKEAWDYQLSLFEKAIQQKKDNGFVENKILLCEHPHVITLGKNTESGNLLYNENFLKDKGVSIYQIDRGGDITYHGYGQLVVYPILDLESLNMGLKEYIFKLEEVVIQLLADYGIQAARAQAAPGVWIGDWNKAKESRKICAIGVKSSRYVTMHGLALNVSTDLSYFSLINPCGFIDRGVTSMMLETEKSISLEEVKSRFKDIFENIFLKGART